MIANSLAYVEMRLVLARMLFNFDISLSDDSREWMENQKAYNMWSKPPMHIHLTPRRIG